MKKVYFLITGALLIGLFVYLFYRSEHTVVNELVTKIIPAEDFFRLRQFIRRTVPLSGFAIYSMPEGLWVFSVTLTSKTFYLQTRHFRIEGVIIPLIVSTGLEFIQLFHLTHGRFDALDILASVLGWAVALYLIPYSPERHNILKSLNNGSIASLANYAIVYLSYVMK